MNDKNYTSSQRPPLLPVVVGTGLGSGFWPWGPGTAGSVLALLIWEGLVWLGLGSMALFTVTMLLIILSTVAGTWAVSRLQPYWGEDPSRVVIDEMAGVWIPLAFLAPFSSLALHDEWWWALVALVLFRFFDIVKPLGVKYLDKQMGAFYVMADDLLGGVYAALVLMLLKMVYLWVR